MNAGSWSADALVERLGADETLARELVAIFLGDYPRIMSALREAVAHGTSDEVRQAAHAVKGCVANFTDVGPTPVALALETLAREQETNAYPEALASLEQEMKAFVEQLERFARS